MIFFLSQLNELTKGVLFIGVILLSFIGALSAQELSPATQKLFDAVHKGDLSQVQVSIAGGADIDAVNTWGITPVDLAGDKGHFKILHFLLQVRDLKKKKIKPAPLPDSPPVISLGANEDESVNPTTAPPLPSTSTAALVGQVFSPPPGYDPWSATAVTLELPTPPAPTLPAGPSPFDSPVSAAETSLPIIGTVRGPAPSERAIDLSTTQIAVEDTFQDDDSGVWSNIKSFLNLDSDPQVATAPPIESSAPKAPVKKTLTTKVQEVPTALPTAPVSPPNVKAPPLPIEEKVLPKKVSPAPIKNLSGEDLEVPQVMPVRPKAKMQSSKNRTPIKEPSADATKPADPPTNIVTYLGELLGFEKEFKPKNITLLNLDGRVTEAFDDNDKAIEHLELALASDMKTFGEDHPDVAAYRSYLGLAWHAKGNYDKAIKYLELALASSMKTFGEDHPDVAAYRSYLGLAWHAKGNYDKAIKYLELALEILEKKLSHEHPSIKTVQNNLTAIKSEKRRAKFP